MRAAHTTTSCSAWPWNRQDMRRRDGALAMPGAGTKKKSDDAQAPRQGPRHSGYALEPGNRDRGRKGAMKRVAQPTQPPPPPTPVGSRRCQLTAAAARHRRSASTAGSGHGLGLHGERRPQVGESAASAPMAARCSTRDGDRHRAGGTRLRKIAERRAGCTRAGSRRRRLGRSADSTGPTFCSMCMKIGHRIL